MNTTNRDLSALVSKLDEMIAGARKRENSTPNIDTCLYWRGRADAYEAARALLAAELAKPTHS